MGHRYFFIVRSTCGTARSPGSVTSKSWEALNPNIPATMEPGNICWAILNFVAMSL